MINDGKVFLTSEDKLLIISDNFILFDCMTCPKKIRRTKKEKKKILKTIIIEINILAKQRDKYGVLEIKL